MNKWYRPARKRNQEKWTIDQAYRIMKAGEYLRTLYMMAKAKGIHV